MCAIPGLFVQPDPSGIYRRKSQVGEVPAKPLVPTGLCQHGRKKSLGSSVLSGELLQALPRQKCTHLRATSAVSMRRTPPAETPLDFSSMAKVCLGSTRPCYSRGVLLGTGDAGPRSLLGVSLHQDYFTIEKVAVK